MKILIPTNDDKGLESSLSKHFGKAKFYTLVTLSENAFTQVVSHPNAQEQNHSCGGSAEKVLSLEPDLVVVGGIGANPARIFAQNGLDVKIDSASSTVAEVLTAVQNGTLESLEGKGTCSSH